MSKLVLFLTIQLIISTVFCLYTVECKTVLFKKFSLAYACSLNVKNSSISNTPGQSGPGNNGNQGVLCIPQSSSITGASSSDCFGSYQDIHWGSLNSLQRISETIM